jgi:hypothetical protein
LTTAIARLASQNYKMINVRDGEKLETITSKRGVARMGGQNSLPYQSSRGGSGRGLEETSLRYGVLSFPLLRRDERGNGYELWTRFVDLYREVVVRWISSTNKVVEGKSYR